MPLPESEHRSTDTVERVPAFTVATALAWLGHDDCHTCPKQVDARANVWLVVPAPGGKSSGMRALVDVEFIDPPWSRAEGDRVVAEINLCTCRDGIRVDQRTDVAHLAVAVTGKWPNPVAEQ